MNTDELLERYKRQGAIFHTNGLRSFSIQSGEGAPVLCLHGVPASAFLYRKVVPELAQNGLKGIAIDLPGLGLADRPNDFDYSWTGLGRWLAAAVNALELDRFHLVVHDIGGPVGFELISHMPERIQSLTVLNTLLATVGTFKKPWVMRPFEVKRLGELYLATMNQWTFPPLMYMQGVKDRASLPLAEAGVYAKLLKRVDNGRAFLKIMRSFEPTPEKQALYIESIRKINGPMQIIWGANDPALTPEQHARPIRDAFPKARYFEIPGKHFLQEDNAPFIASKIAELISNEDLV